MKSAGLSENEIYKRLQPYSEFRALTKEGKEKYIQIYNHYQGKNKKLDEI